jgi:UPF0176 protein
MKFFITTFYKFITIKPEDLKTTQEHFKSFGKNRDIKGLMLLATEGINSTVCAPSENSLNELKNEVEKYFGKIDYKDSTAPKQVFRIMKVAIRKEIVTLNIPDYVPENHNPKHLSPAEWNETIRNENPVVVDTRNWYENEIGMFKGAIDLKIDEFTDFKDKFNELNIPKDKKILMYCTGGIRCEKGNKNLQDLGYHNVFQLKDGILKYLEEFPNDLFEGECFVFDERVAVDQKLEPSKKYAFCPHCGQPAKNIQNCKRCDTEFKSCQKCQDEKATHGLCSKDCAYQWGRFQEKGTKQLQGYKAIKQNAYFLNR